MVFEDSYLEDKSDISVTNEVGFDMSPLTNQQAGDRDSWVQDFSDILTDLPGKVKSVRFSIATDLSPIQQRPYTTRLPRSQGSRKKLVGSLSMDTLFHNSWWAIPILTVRKLNGKFVYALTSSVSMLYLSQTPFLCHK